MFQRAVHPGIILKAELARLGVSPSEFSRQIQVSPSRDDTAPPCPIRPVSYTTPMLYQLPPAGQQILRAFLKSWLKWTTLLPVVMPLGLALFLALLYALANLPPAAAADLILNSLGESYLSLALPAAQFWITAYLLAALSFVTGWESARPASWLLPTLALQSWTTRLERLLRLRHLPRPAAPAHAPSLHRRRCLPPGPTGLQPPATLTGAMPLLE